MQVNLKISIWSYMYYNKKSITINRKWIKIEFLQLEFTIKVRSIENARFKNISIRCTGNKYSMVRVFSRSIDRNQSFFPRCINIPLFCILVINTRYGGGEEDSKYNSIVETPILSSLFFFVFNYNSSRYKRERWKVNSNSTKRPVPDFHLRKCI